TELKMMQQPYAAANRRAPSASSGQAGGQADGSASAKASADKSDDWIRSRPLAQPFGPSAGTEFLSPLPKRLKCQRLLQPTGPGGTWSTLPGAFAERGR